MTRSDFIRPRRLRAPTTGGQRVSYIVNQPRNEILKGNVGPQIISGTLNGVTPSTHTPSYQPQLIVKGKSKKYDIEKRRVSSWWHGVHQQMAEYHKHKGGLKPSGPAQKLHRAAHKAHAAAANAYKSDHPKAYNATKNAFKQSSKVHLQEHDLEYGVEKAVPFKTKEGETGYKKPGYKIPEGLEAPGGAEWRADYKTGEEKLHAFPGYEAHFSGGAARTLGGTPPWEKDKEEAKKAVDQKAYLGTLKIGKQGPTYGGEGTRVAGSKVGEMKDKPTAPPPVPHAELGGSETNKSVDQKGIARDIHRQSKPSGESYTPRQKQAVSEMAPTRSFNPMLGLGKREFTFSSSDSPVGEKFKVNPGGIGVQFRDKTEKAIRALQEAASKY